MKIGDSVYSINNNEINGKEELTAIYTTRKSFYKKAFILYMKNGDVVLQSYSTIVAIYHNDGTFESGKYSQTTNRHIKEFKRQWDENDIDNRHDFIDYEII